MTITSSDFEQALSKFVKYIEENVECEPFVKRIQSWKNNAKSVGDSVMTVHAWTNDRHPLHGGDMKLLLALVCAKFNYEPSTEVTEKILKHLRLLQISSDELIEEACKESREKDGLE